MKKLTLKEEEVMNIIWAKDEDFFVKDALQLLPDPKPHINTLSTVVRSLDEKGFLSHRVYGGTHQYIIAITKEQFKNRSLTDVIGKHFDNSLFSAISSLVGDKAITVEELKELIDIVERGE